MTIGSSIQSCFVTAIALSVGEGAICYHITHSTTETATLLLKRNCCENCRSYIKLLNKIIAVVKKSCNAYMRYLPFYQFQI